MKNIASRHKSYQISMQNYQKVNKKTCLFEEIFYIHEFRIEHKLIFSIFLYRKLRILSKIKRLIYRFQMDQIIYFNSMHINFNN